MAYFVVNHSRKEIYRLSHWRETFYDVMDANPIWTMKDSIDCYDDDVPVIESFLKLDYSSNIPVTELLNYIRDPEFLVWYMDSHEYGDYDISQVIDSCDSTELCEKLESAFNDLIEWRKQNNDMDMLCAAMKSM